MFNSITIKHQTEFIKCPFKLINNSLESLFSYSQTSTKSSSPTPPLSNSTEILLTSRSLSDSSSDMSIDSCDYSSSPIILSSTYDCNIIQNPFNNIDFLSYLLQFLIFQDRYNLLLINKTIRPLIHNYLRLMLSISNLPNQQHSPISLIHPNKKLQFSQTPNLKTKIQILPNQNVEDLYNFLISQNNQTRLNSIEVLQFHDVNSENVHLIQYILDLISQKHINLPNLISISFRDIWANLNISNLNSLLSLHCNDIYADFSLSNLNHLISFSCNSIFKNLIISKLDCLQSFSCKIIRKNKNLTLSQLPNLTSVSCLFLKDGASISLLNLNNLKFIVFGDFAQNSQITIDQPLNLKSLIFNKSCNPFIIKLLNDLIAQIES